MTFFQRNASPRSTMNVTPTTEASTRITMKKMCMLYWTTINRPHCSSSNQIFRRCLSVFDVVRSHVKESETNVPVVLADRPTHVTGPRSVGRRVGDRLAAVQREDVADVFLDHFHVADAA